MSSRREVLANINLNVNENPNAGLWLDKFITDLARDDKDDPSKPKLAREVASINEPENYSDIYVKWQRSLEELGAICCTAEVKNRMAVGLGSESILETSVALHRTYGVPYIPGSALKGLAASFAKHHCGDDWQEGKPFYEIVFGTTDKAGYVTFFDALYDRGSGLNGKALHFDVMTVHHRPYYEQRRDDGGDVLPPADWDDPNPVPFISATGKYLIALAAPEGCEAWRDVAFKVLKLALQHEGIGGKTSSGYGRLTVSEPPPNPSKQKAESLLRAIKSIPSDKLPSELGQQASALLKSDLSSQYKRQVAELIIQRIDAGGTKQRKKFEEKSWFSEVQALLGEGTS